MNTKPVKKNRSVVLIKQANDFIESRYDFDIWEARFFLSVLAKIDITDTGSEVYRIRFKDVIKDFNLKSARSYALLREGARRLMAQKVTINYDKDGHSRAEMYHLIRGIDYLDENNKKIEGVDGQEYIDVRIEETLKPYFLQLSKNFTVYNLKNVSNLSAYALRIYGLLKQYESIGKRVLSVDKMRTMLMLEKEYAIFANFYRWIVLPAIVEINKYTDLKIETPEQIKEGKKVVALAFKITKKVKEDALKARNTQKQSVASLFEEAEIIEIIDSPKVGNIEVADRQIEVDKDALYEQYEAAVVRDFGVKTTEFLKLMDSFNSPQIAQAVRVTQQARELSKVENSLSEYFVKALKEGYSDAEEAEKRALAMAAKTKEERIDERIFDLTSQSRDLALRGIEAVKAQPYYSILIASKEQKLGKTLTVDDYRADEVLRAAVRAKIVELEWRQFEDILGGI